MALVDQPWPTRVLMITASIGEGHNSAAAALAIALRAAEPSCVIHTINALHRMGPGSETFLRRLYRVAVELTPPLQELWYRAVARSAAVRWVYREPIGHRVARGLAEDIARYRPDVVVSTYPLGTAGLSALRQRGQLSAPIIAVLSDFAPHAFWVYPGVAHYLVLSEQGQAALRALAPGVPSTVCAPLVAPEFRPPSAEERAAARHRLGLPPEVLGVLVNCGALGLGSVLAATEAVLAADPRCHAIVACGRNERIRAALGRKHRDRLTALGWVEDMAEVVAAADVVVNNAGGLTAAEALASGRALVMFRPLAGHGRACAEAMKQSGLAVVVSRRRELTELLNYWVAHPDEPRAAGHRAAWYARARRLTDAARIILNHARPGTLPREAAS